MNDARLILTASFGNSISPNLIFINNLGLSFLFWVCYNCMNQCYAYSPVYSRLLFYHTGLRADVMEVS